MILAVGVVLTAVLAAAAPAGAQPSRAVTPPGGGGRIIGGEVAPPGAWPSQAAILRADVPAPQDGQICGGTVIASTWVVTATHCTLDEGGKRARPQDLDVLLGSQDLRRGGTRLGVVEIRRWPTFDPRRLSYDIALLRLDGVSPVPPTTLAAPGEVPPAGTELAIAGWGETETAPYTSVLRQGTVPALSDAECREVLADFDEETGLGAGIRYHPSQLCTGPLGEGGRGPCYGDSGGPLVWEHDGRKVLVGVVSWGFYCGSPETPAVFAKVSAASRWISDQIKFGPFDRAEDLALVTFLLHDPDVFDLEVEDPGPAVLAHPLTRQLRNGLDPGEFMARVQQLPAVQRRDANIVRLYRAVLDRPPDAYGYAYWRMRVDAGMLIRRVAELMTRSPEFRARYAGLGNSAYVEALYDNVLARPGDPGGVAYWTGRLDSGMLTRPGVVLLIALSAENRARTDAPANVHVAYLNLLGRAARDTEVGRWQRGPLAELSEYILQSRAFALEVFVGEPEF